MFQIGFSLFKWNLVDNSVTNNLSKPYCRQKKSDPFRGRSCFVPYLLHPIEPNKMVDRT